MDLKKACEDLILIVQHAEGGVMSDSEMFRVSDIRKELANSKECKDLECCLCDKHSKLVVIKSMEKLDEKIWDGQNVIRNGILQCPNCKKTYTMGD